MQNQTKRAIKDACVALLNERPLSRISVKDIVNACGINRNSFYYHFKDLPALLEEIFAEQIQSLMDRYPGAGSIEACFDAAVKFVLENRQVILHIYNSVRRDIFEQYLMEFCRRVVTAYVEADFAGRPVDEKDKEMLIRYHKCECFGNIIDWLNGGMKEDISTYFHRIYQLKRGWEGEVLRREKD